MYHLFIRTAEAGVRVQTRGSNSATKVLLPPSVLAHDKTVYFTG